ncbi:hypothetical protein HaLaN_16867, partial [Haematococcus lacustris]
MHFTRMCLETVHHPHPEWGCSLPSRVNDVLRSVAATDYAVTLTLNHEVRAVQQCSQAGDCQHTGDAGQPHVLGTDVL